MGNSYGKSVLYEKIPDKISEDGESCAVWDAGSLSVFPEEVWEYILDHLLSSTQVYAVLLAFPELDRCFHTKKVIWMFDQVLPQLMTTYLINRRLVKCGIFKWKDCLADELLKLRLVSKSWKRAVDSSIEKHVDRNSPRSTQIARSQLSLEQISLNHFNYNRISNFRLGEVIFESDEQVESFIRQMRDHAGNPFPGKFVYLKSSIGHYTECNSLVEKCVELFENFGKHVLCLEIEFCGDERKCHLELCKNILKCLCYVPNLKSLTINGKYGYDADKKAREYFREPVNIALFPDLPHLQVFDWKVRFAHGARSPAGSTWVEHLLNKYAGGNGIRKLRIDQHSVMLPNVLTRLSGLTELHLQLDSSEYLDTSVIGRILENLPNSKQLQTFGVNTTFYFRKVFDITKLIIVLADFPIRNLILDDVKLVENSINDRSQAFIVSTTITTLLLRDELRLNYEFLKLLPNLQLLHIYFDEVARKEASEYWEAKPKCKQSLFSKLSWDFGGTSLLAKSLRTCILGAYVNDCSNFEHLEFIWKKLPNLNMLKGSVELRIVEREYHYGIWDVQFVRECGNKVFLGCKPNWPIVNPYEM